MESLEFVLKVFRMSLKVSVKAERNQSKVSHCGYLPITSSDLYGVSEGHDILTKLTEWTDFNSPCA